MKKATFSLLAVAILAGMTSTVWAQQESVLFFDIRDNTTTADFGGGNGQLISAAKRPFTTGDGDTSHDANLVGAINLGKEGSGQVMRLSPVGVASPWQNNNAYGAALNNEAWPNLDRDNLLSTANAWLYLKMNANLDTIPGVNDVYSSMGVHIDGKLLTGQTAARNTIASVSFQLFNSGVAGVASGSPWNNKIDGAAVAAVSPGPPQWGGAKAARVPVNTGPVYQQSLGMAPSASQLYRVGSLRVTAGTRNCSFSVGSNNFTRKSNYEYRLRNNNILTTRVFQSGGDSPGAEAVAYGYSTAPAAVAGELANASGSVENATSTTPDLIVQVRAKGDLNGDGAVNGNDTPLYLPFLPSTASPNVSTCYLVDFNHDRQITGNDTPGYLTALTFGAGACP